MNLVSMEVTPQDKKEGWEEASLQGPKYPYGLRLHLDKEALKKLGIKDLPEIGSEMFLVAKAKVVSLSEDDPNDPNMGLQLIEMEIKSEKKEESKSTEDALYGD